MILHEEHEDSEHTEDKSLLYKTRAFIYTIIVTSHPYIHTCVLYVTALYVSGCWHWLMLALVDPGDQGKVLVWVDSVQSAVTNVIHKIILLYIN